MTLVSVVMITYNHEHFIREAIEGVLMQKTDFQIELVIGEDCSTDLTRQICEEYAQQHPEIIRLLPSEKNLGVFPNFIRTLEACTGKYIAMCEGDDYWTDPMKLQKQVDFLEGNEGFAICFHDVFFHFEANVDKLKLPEQWYDEEQTVFSFEDLLKNGNFLFTPSVVFRNGSNEFPFVNCVTVDYFLHLHNSSSGKIKKLKQKMATYRIHKGGIYSQKSSWNVYQQTEYFEKQINAFNLLYDKFCHTKQRKMHCKRHLCNLYLPLRFNYIETNQYLNSRKACMYVLRNIKYSDSKRFRDFLSLLINLISPGFFRKK